MPIRGDIKLGASAATLRDYLLVDPRQISIQSANPLSPRLNTGEKYAELSGWSEAVFQDWQGGVGRTKTEDGGFLYANLDSRVSGQLILPPALGGSTMSGQSDTYGAGFNLPLHATTYTSQTVTTAGTVRRIAVKVFATPANVVGFTVSVPLLYVDTATVTCSLAADSTGSPGTVAATATATLDAVPYPQWVTFSFSATLTAATTYWLYLSGSFTALCSTTWTGGTAKTYNGSAWATASVYPFFVTDVWAKATAADGYFSFTRSPQRLTGLVESNVTGSHYVYNTAYNASSNTWATPTSSTTLSADKTVLTAETYNVANSLDVAGSYKLEVQGNGIVNLSNSLPYMTVSNDDTFVASPGALFDGYIYTALGDTYVALEAGTGGGSPVSAASTSFASWRGFLWRGSDANVYYSGDGTTWSDAIKVGSDDYLVRGLAGLETGIHAATDEGLFYVGDGDIVFGITPWGTRAIGEIRMINHQSALCIPISGRIWRLSGDENIMDIWISREDDLPLPLLGSPLILASMNNWLLAAVDAGATETSSVWAWQTEGWHHIATLPTGFRPTALYYDRELARLWIGTTGSYAFYVKVDDNAINPYNSTTSRFDQYGWLETPRIYGDLIKIDKDFESVFITGDFAAGTSCGVYFQSDQDSTWQLLGTVTADNTELQWNDIDTRPTGKWLKLGLLLATNDPTITPRVTAIVLKYLPMVTDKERWNLPLILASDQEMRDGSMNDYTVAQQMAHVKSLVTTVAPIMLEDIDGTQYRVKVEGASRQLMHYQQGLVERVATQNTSISTSTAVPDEYLVDEGVTYTVGSGVTLIVGDPAYDGVAYGRRTLEWVYTLAVVEL